MTKKEILSKLQTTREFAPVDQQNTAILTMEARGCDISTPNYKGDLFNHRLVALILMNGVKIVIEATATRTKRTTHAITGKPLKHEKTFYDDNGLMVEFSVEDFPTFEKGWGFGYRSFPSSFHTGSKWICDISDFNESAHTKKRLLSSINAELKTHFQDIIILNNSNSEYLTIDEALKDGYIRNFESQPMKQEEEPILYNRAQERWKLLKRFGIVPYNESFITQSCWITSGSLHGFYFPNTKSPIRAIVFGVYGRVICVLNNEDNKESE